jgi:hypothetical protein
MPRERYFLSILAGPNPRCTRPILSTEDPAVVRAAIKAMFTRVAGAERVPVAEGESAGKTAPEERVSVE